VFAVMMIVAAISGWMSLKRLSSRGLLRVVYWFALILITLSIPIHVRSVVIWSTAWVHVSEVLQPRGDADVPRAGIRRDAFPLPWRRVYVRANRNFKRPFPSLDPQPFAADARTVRQLHLDGRLYSHNAFRETFS